MIYVINIGGVLIKVETPFELIWKKEEEQFITDKLEIEPEYSIKIIEVEEMPAIKGKLVYERDEMQVYTEGKAQIRYFGTRNLGESGIWSIYEDQEIRIYVRKNSYGNTKVRYHLWKYMFLEKILLESSALVLHSVYMECNGKGICITAPSGTGKTTQAEHWVKKYQAQILNGDKSLVRMEKDGWFVHGYPFHGSARECENKKNVLDTIVILRQGKENEVKELTIAEKVRLLYSELTVNIWNSQDSIKVLELVEKLAKNVRIVLYYCTKEIESAEVLYQFLFEGK